MATRSRDAPRHCRACLETATSGGALLLVVRISPSDDDLSRRHGPRQAERLAPLADHDETAGASCLCAHIPAICIAGLLALWESSKLVVRRRRSSLSPTSSTSLPARRPSSSCAARWASTRGSRPTPPSHARCAWYQMERVNQSPPAAGCPVRPAADLTARCTLLGRRRRARTCGCTSRTAGRQPWRSRAAN